MNRIGYADNDQLDLWVGADIVDVVVDFYSGVVLSCVVVGGGGTLEDTVEIELRQQLDVGDLEGSRGEPVAEDAGVDRHGDLLDLLALLRTGD